MKTYQEETPKVKRQIRTRLVELSSKLHPLISDFFDTQKGETVTMVLGQKEMYQKLFNAYKERGVKGVEAYVEIHATQYMRLAVQYPQYYHLNDQLLYEQEGDPEKKEQLKVIAEQSKAFYDRVLAAVRNNGEKVALLEKFEEKIAQIKEEMINGFNVEVANLDILSLNNLSELLEKSSVQEICVALLRKLQPEEK